MEQKSLVSYLSHSQSITESLQREAYFMAQLVIALGTGSPNQHLLIEYDPY